MTDLFEKLKEIAERSSTADAPYVKAAAYRIKDLETKLARYEEDITDWQVAVEAQMGRSKDGK